MPWLYILFFCSGFPALIYQIVWQRALLSIYGVNIESVTIVVSAFMLGLGIGSYLGGIVSKRPNLPLLAIFGGIEVSIGLFGCISLPLFHWVGINTSQAPLLVTGLVTFALVLVPTTLMGATLPILVSNLVRLSGNVGTSVGILYFVNTLGSAVACLMSAKFIMGRLGESGSVYLAAAINGIVGVLAIAAHVRASSPGKEPVAPADAPPAELQGSPVIPFPWAVVAAGVCGLISLAYEIVWYRAYSFASGSHAKAFALLLAAYLEGIAFGSLFSRSICQAVSGKTAARCLAAISGFAIVANLIGYMVTPAMAFSVRFVPYVLTMPMVTLSTCLLGALFPLICHVSIAPDAKAGARLSYLYLSNIIGSVCGTLLVGFILMDLWSIRQISLFLVILGVLLGSAFALTVLRGVRLAGALGAAAFAVLIISISSGPLFDRIYEEMLYKNDYRLADRFAHVVESRSGVVAVSRDGTVFGNGVYDGRFNTSPLRDTNMIIRAYAIAGFHPAPRKVLMIGLASGSWAQVIVNHPAVESMTIVEINPGYLQLIPRYPEVAGILRNPKVKIVIDDGRRWLVRNPSRQFDLIAMNTTYHWREHSTNLLSTDFLRLASQHLLPGGMLFYNTTWSGEVQLTGATVFPYALRVVNFLAVSNAPIHMDKARWKSRLEEYHIEGKPVFDLTRAQDQKKLNEMLALADTLGQKPTDAQMALELQDTIRVRCQGKRIITDDNMGTEWLE